MICSATSLRALLVAACSIFCIQASHGATDGTVSPALTHPITERVLAHEGADPQLVQNPAVRKWLQAVEDDAEIRAALGVGKLEETLNDATSVTCRACTLTRNLRRLAPQERMAFVASGMPLSCKRPLTAEAAASMDLDAAYRIFYQGLQAEVRSLPKAALTPEQASAAEEAFGMAFLKLAADRPELLKTAQAAAKGPVDSDAACEMAQIVRPALEKTDAAQRDNALLYVLGGADQDRSPRLKAPFKSASAVLDADFVPAAMPEVLRKQLRTSAPALPFSRVKSSYTLSITQADANHDIYVRSNCSVKGAVVRCANELSAPDGGAYSTVFAISDAFPWTWKQQAVTYVDGKSGIAEYSVMTDVSQRPTRILPDQRYAFSIWRWAGEDRKTGYKQDVTCHTGGRFAASTILLELEGMAIDMICSIKDAKKGDERFTFTYLERQKLFTVRNYVGPEQKYVVDPISMAFQ